MLGSEIIEYADLSETEMQQVEKIFKMFTKDWEIGKSQFRCGIVATLGYIKRNIMLSPEYTGKTSIFNGANGVDLIAEMCLQRYNNGEISDIDILVREAVCYGIKAGQMQH